MHASKSSCKHASAAARQWHKSCRPANAGERRRNGLVAGNGARLELQPLAFAAYPQRRSSSANSLCGQNSAGSVGNLQDFSKR
jgi:hypothetical protein